MYKNETKAKKGSVVVQSFAGRLRLQLPRAIAREIGRERAFIYLGLADTSENRKLAEAKAKLAESDIAYERFDFSFEKYKIVNSGKPHLTVIESIKKDLTTSELFEKYLAFKEPLLKESSFHQLKAGVFPYLKKCHYQSIDNALEIRDWLLNNTTNDMTKRVLINLNAAVKWGIKYKLLNLKISPFDGMATELPKYNWEKDPRPNAFTQDEKEAIINGFQNHKGNWNGRGVTGFGYCYYAPLVQFLFMTGCRPSEGIGLTWGQVSDDCSTIIFDRARVQLSNGKIVESEGSKNSRYRKNRKLPCTQKLQELLLSLKPDIFNSDDLVFPSVKGKVINYGNFCKKAWDKVVDPIINRASTPYSCRDTFMSEQISRGIAPEIVARWCDSSADTIRKHYLDDKLLEHLRPRDN